MEYSFSISEIVVVLLTLICTALGYVIKNQKDKITEIERQLSEKKYDLYYKVYSLVFDLFKDQKNKIQTDEKELGLKIIDIKKDMLIYAPDNVLDQFILWNEFVQNNSNDPRHFKLYMKLFILVRKDMGHQKTKFNEDDFWRLVMADKLQIIEMKKYIASFDI